MKGDGKKCEESKLQLNDTDLIYAWQTILYRNKLGYNLVMVYLEITKCSVFGKELICHVMEMFYLFL